MHESIELQMSLLLAVALGSHLLSGLVLMSLVTTLVVPILLRNWLYRTPQE